MRLRYVSVADFRKSELTNFTGCQKELKTMGIHLTKDDVVLFISHRGDQLMFVSPTANVAREARGQERPVEVLRSVRMRIRSGRWDPKMLSRYAEENGIQLEGIRKFEQHYRNLVEVAPVK